MHVSKLNQTKMIKKNKKQKQRLESIEPVESPSTTLTHSIPFLNKYTRS